jgi:hypothetical protein
MEEVPHRTADDQFKPFPEHGLKLFVRGHS